jgi:ATP-dependent RNA helicase DBP3
MAFGIPLVQHVLSLPSKKKKAGVQALVVAPTRELAMQTYDALSTLGEPLGIHAVCIYGGVPKYEQKQALNSGARIVVGTPGRILDLANEEALDLSKVSWVVLDEADRMLDKGGPIDTLIIKALLVSDFFQGFENDIRSIIGRCLPSPSLPIPLLSSEPPTSRHTSMFSATWPTAVRRLASDFLISPIRITVGNDELTASTSVEQSVVVLDDGRQKESNLLRTLKENGFLPRNRSKEGKLENRDKVLVFALYKKEAARLEGFLRDQGYDVGCIQGDLGQDKRTKALADFKAGITGVLVATGASSVLDLPF